MRPFYVRMTNTFLMKFRSQIEGGLFPSGEHILEQIIVFR
jgi:hypothetical protein